MAIPSFEQVAGILCDRKSQYSGYEKAILLFGMQVGAVSPNSPTMASAARQHAAMKMLEALELAHEIPSEASIEDRLAIPSYSEIFRQMLVRDGGWKRLSRNLSRKKLAEQISIRWAEARDAARLVEFSYRFVRQRDGDDRMAGVTMARKIISQTRRISDGTLKTRHREYGKSAVLVFVLRNIGGMRPAKLNGKEFVQKISSLAADTDKMREIFSLYREVSKLLRPRGYNCPPVEIEGLPQSRHLPDAKPFSDRELAAIDEYRS